MAVHMVHACGVIAGPHVNLHELFSIDFDTGKEWMMGFEYKDNGLNLQPPLSARDSSKVIEFIGFSKSSLKIRLIQLNRLWWEKT